MNNELTPKIDALDDKHAIYVLQSLTAAVFKATGEPSYQTMATALDQARAPRAGEPLISDHEEWRKVTLKAGEAARAARAVLHAWAADQGLAPAVDKAIDKFKTPKQDLGIMSVPLALGLTYALIAIDLDIDLGFVKIKKKGLSGAQQTAIVRKTIEPVLGALGIPAGT